MEITNLLQWAHAHREQLIGLILGGSAALSVVLETVLHKFRTGIKLPFISKVVKFDPTKPEFQKKVGFTLLHLFASLTAVGAFYLDHIPSKAAVGVWATLAICAQFWHRFVVSGAYIKYVEPYLNFLAQQKAPTTNPAVNSIATATITNLAPAAGGVAAGTAKPFTLEGGR
jgi:hypothetical protein